MSGAQASAAANAGGLGRVLQVGVSYNDACGIRDYARILGDELSRRGCSVESVWWERDDGGSCSPMTLGGFRVWRKALDERLTGGGVDVVLWHYSVFGYGWRGIPVFAAPAARRLAGSHVPVVAVLHEFGHPWWWPGWRGSVFALTQRLALVPVLRASSLAVVTTEERRRWIADQWWLPSVATTFQPVFSTVPRCAPADERPRVTGPASRIGVFGYAAARMRPDVVVEALEMLRAEGRDVGLTLVGAPGPDAPGGRRWQRAAEEAGTGVDLAFTGPLEPAQLSRTLSSLDVVVFPDDAGPTSRKTTLAAALAHGCCIVALDGDSTWEALVTQRGVVPSRPDPADLASHLRRLLDDAEARREQQVLAMEFYARNMAPGLVVERLLPLLARAHSATSVGT